MVSCKKWHSVSAAVHKVRLEYISFLRLGVPFEVNDFYNRQRFWSWTIWTDFWRGFRFGFFGFLQKNFIWRNFLGIFWKFSVFLDFFSVSGIYHFFGIFLLNWTGKTTPTGILELELITISFVIFHAFLEFFTFFLNFSHFLGIVPVFFGKFSRFFGIFHISFRSCSRFFVFFLLFTFYHIFFLMICAIFLILYDFHLQNTSFFPPIPSNLTKKNSHFFSFKKSRSNQKHRQYHQELVLPLKHWTYQLSVWKRKCTAPL